MEEHKWMLKHTSTPAYDLFLTLRIDRAKRSAELLASSFDSFLVGGFVVNTMPRYFIHAFDDGRDDSEGVRVTWSLTYVLSGVRLRCAVVRMRDYAMKQDTITVVLGEPVDPI